MACATIALAVMTAARRAARLPAGALARPRGALVGLVVQIPLALPPLMSGIVLIYVVGPYTFLGRLFGGRLTDSTTGIVIAMTFVAAPFLVVAARAAFASVEPGAARRRGDARALGGVAVLARGRARRERRASARGCCSRGCGPSASTARS